MYEIEKSQTNSDAYQQKSFFYPAAREAMRDFIACYAENNANMQPINVLLPAYIGWSPNEGSGIFDPIVGLEQNGIIKASLYAMTDNLEVDILDAMRLIELNQDNGFIFLKVNYFGFSDSNEERLYDEVKARGGVLLEDNAHSFFSYMMRQDHFCDACFFSLHKQFPFDEGGMLRVLNKDLESLLYSGKPLPSAGGNPFAYDWAAISAARRSNFFALYELLGNHLDLWTPLRSISSDDRVVPQTLPILLNDCDRFGVYKDLNSQGWGVTSLYHTLVEPIYNSQRFSESVKISESILNLPVHQDVDPSLYVRFVDSLTSACVSNSMRR